MVYLYNDLVIALCFDDYSPDKSGEADVSELLQTALDDVKKLGGGTLLVKAGKYRLDSSVTVPPIVFLAGDGADKTVFFCRHGENQPDGVAQIVLSGNSAMLRLALVYDKQNYSKPVPYSMCVRQGGADSITLDDVNIIGAWRGVQSGPDTNMLHFLRNVRIAPLNIGFYMDMTTDIGRMQNLTIDPTAAYGYLPKPNADALVSYALENATGIFMARSDWEYGHDIHISGCKNGMVITAVEDCGPNTQLSDVYIHNCEVGIRFIDVNPYGVALTNSEIVNDNCHGEAAILCEETFETLIQLCGVKLSGDFDNPISKSGKGELTLYDCKLKSDDNTISVCGGGLLLLKCEIDGDFNIKIDGEGVKASLVGCKYEHLNVQGAADGNFIISDKCQPLPALPEKSYVYYSYPVFPDVKHLYNVKAYGAASDGLTDCTAQIQSALDEAAKNGGGTVYLPAGRYLCAGRLKVGANTELRGIFAAQCHTFGGGSMLMTTVGADDEDAEPFITLAESAGVRGLIIYHPEQDAVNPRKYPWTIRSNGRFCRVIDTIFVNPWLGVDFATNPSEGHFISYISGAPIKCGVYLGSNDGEGWVENIQFNPHYWVRSRLPNSPDGEKWVQFWHNQMKYLDAIVFGRNKNEHIFNNFVFAANHGLLFKSQDGGVTNGVCTGHGTDSGETALCIRALGEVDFLNTELVTIEAENRRVYLMSEKDSSGKANFFNTLMWGVPHNAVILRGADVTMICGNYQSQGECANIVEGGKSVFAGNWFYKRGDNFQLCGGETTLIANRTWDGDID